MKKRFIVVADLTTVEQDTLFKQWVEGKFNWWNWLHETWLLVDNRGLYTAKEIRDKAMECFPTVNCLVFEFGSDGSETWAGFGPSSETDPKRNMFAWIKNNWNKY
jgi:hypothetical protein